MTPARNSALPRRLAREEEQRGQLAVSKIGSEVREGTKAATNDVSTADAARDRLHFEISKFAATACGDPGVCPARSVSQRAGMVLSDFF